MNPNLCGRVLPMMSAAIDRELSQSDHLLVQRHLATCESCRAEYEGLKRAKAMFAGLPDVQVDEAAQLARLRRRFAREGRSFRRRAVMVSVLASACAILAALAVTGFSQPEPAPDWAKIESTSDSAYGAGPDDMGAPTRVASVALTNR